MEVCTKPNLWWDKTKYCYVLNYVYFYGYYMNAQY